jgi:hypothetical protein
MNQTATAESSSSQPLDDLADKVSTREDFAAFVQALVADYQRHQQVWENRDLPSFLEALGVWAADLDGFYQNRGETVPDQPSWKLLAQMLLAARVYE